MWTLVETMPSGEIVSRLSDVNFKNLWPAFSSMLMAGCDVDIVPERQLPALLGDHFAQKICVVHGQLGCPHCSPK